MATPFTDLAKQADQLRNAALDARDRFGYANADDLPEVTAAGMNLADEVASLARLLERTLTLLGAQWTGEG